MSITLQQRFAQALEQRGERLVKTTSKFWVYTLAAVTVDGKPAYLYLGKAGSLRIGRTIGDSRPIAASDKQKLLAEVA